MGAAWVAAGIQPAVEGGILPPGPAILFVDVLALWPAIPAGQAARLYGRQDACRYDPGRCQRSCATALCPVTAAWAHWA